jgi:heat shock protein HslJ
MKTSMTCGEEKDQQEHQFMSLIEQVTHYALAGDSLVLIYGDEEALITAKAIE